MLQTITQWNTSCHSGYIYEDTNSCLKLMNWYWTHFWTHLNNLLVLLTKDHSIHNENEKKQDFKISTGPASIYPLVEHQNIHWSSINISTGPASKITSIGNRASGLLCRAFDYLRLSVDFVIAPLRQLFSEKHTNVKKLANKKLRAYIVYRWDTTQPLTPPPPHLAVSLNISIL